jgi:hypothetical protein
MDKIIVETNTSTRVNPRSLEHAAAGASLFLRNISTNRDVPLFAGSWRSGQEDLIANKLIKLHLPGLLTATMFLLVVVKLLDCPVGDRENQCDYNRHNRQQYQNLDKSKS